MTRRALPRVHLRAPLPSHKFAQALLTLGAILCWSSPALAEDAEPPTSPGIGPSLGWALGALMPSPGVILDASRGARLHLRWHLTPLLWSWSLRDGLSPWRALVAEPMTRHGGSLETFLSPEVTGLAEDFASSWSVRAGGRVYLPLYSAGEYVSMSLGGSYAWGASHQGPAMEAGLYALYGFTGVQVTWAPWADRGQLMTTFVLRFM